MPYSKALKHQDGESFTKRILTNDDAADVFHDPVHMDFAHKTPPPTDLLVVVLFKELLTLLQLRRYSSKQYRAGQKTVRGSLRFVNRRQKNAFLAEKKLNL